jgi:hypothetical protein
MSSTNALNDRRAGRAGRASRASLAEPAPRRATRRWLAFLVVVAGVVAGCGVDTAAPGDAQCVPPPSGTAPTYSELYTKYFAPKTPGHCATSDCHLDGVQGWTCGLNKTTCYTGMVDIGIIDKKVPTASTIGDPRYSPIRWINPSGPMPQDTPGPFPEGAAAIKAWVAACALNN